MSSIVRRVRRHVESISARGVVLALAVLVTFGAARARAQAPVEPRTAGVAAPPSPLRLGELYAEAQRANARIDAARALARAAEARIAGSKRPPDPELQLGFMNYTLPELSPMEPLGMTQLQLMLMIPTAGKLGLAGRVAAGEAAALDARAAEVGWEVRAEVASAFYGLYETEQALAVGRETLRLLEDTRRIAEAMYRVGEGRQTDVLRAHVEIARMAEDTLRMVAMRAAMRARLAAVLNRADDAVAGSPVLPRFPDAVPALPALVSLADGRPMIRAAARDVETAGARSALVRREIWPDIAVGVQYSQARVTMPGGIDAEGVPMPGERRTERMGSLMLGASVPIFARSRQLRMREEMGAMERMAEAELTAMRADTRGKIAEAHAELLRARRLAALYRTTVIPQAEAAAQSSLSAYRVGSVDFMTLLDNRMAVNDYRRELFALEAEEGRAWAELEMLLGRALIDASSVVAAGTTAGGAR